MQIDAAIAVPDGDYFLQVFNIIHLFNEKPIAFALIMFRERQYMDT
jgi:hypothetical protein